MIHNTRTNDSLSSAAPPSYTGDRAGASSATTDVRTALDSAVRRLWGEVAWRAARGGALATSDVMAAAASAAVAALVSPVSAQPGGFGLGLSFVVTFLIMHIVGMAWVGSYGLGRKRLQLGRLILGSILGAAVGVLNVMLLTPRGIDHGVLYWLTAYLAVLIPLTLVCRNLLDRCASLVYRRGLWQRRVLIVGNGAPARKLEERVRSELGHIRVVGLVSASYSAEPGSIGTLRDLRRIVDETGARGVLVDGQLTFEALETLVHRCFDHGLSVSVVPRTLHKLSPRLELRETHVGSLVQLWPQGPRMPQLLLKRALDVALSSIALVVLSPLLLLIALAIRLDSPGSILFKQTRAGVGGRPFDMYKFRTMVADADLQKKDLQHLNQSGDPRLFKIVDDPRITRVGRILRKFSLDELPQLANVLKGDMSLVGPRPFFPQDLADYADHHFTRLDVLPGITGWWQVRGRSAVVDFEEVVKLDTEYIRDWSLWLDIRILVLTIPAVFRRTGAY